MAETDLYAPVKRFLEARGFAVRAEVQGCDVVAVRGGDLVVVELKRRPSLDLFLQAVDRQKLTDAVYVAVEAPRSRRGHWPDLHGLCRRLGLGLIAVSLAAPAPGVEVVCDPAPYAPRGSRARRLRLLREFEDRSGDHNVGGSTRHPLVTAYREAALRIARLLEARGPTGLKQIRESTGCAKAGGILQRDVYGWFSRVDRGVYAVAPAGRAALAAYADVVAAFETPEEKERRSVG